MSKLNNDDIVHVIAGNKTLYQVGSFYRPKISIKEASTEFQKMNEETREAFEKESATFEDFREYLILHQLSSELQTHIETEIDKLLPTCQKTRKKSFKTIMTVCDAFSWAQSTKFNRIIYHGTSLSATKSIILNGFYPFSLFSANNIYQSLQWSSLERRDNPILLICFANVENVENRNRNFNYIGDWEDEWEREKKRMQKYNIDASYELTSLVVRNPNNVTIIGFVTFPTINEYKIYLFT